FPRLQEVLAPYAARGLRALIHCFGGKPPDVRPYIDWGWRMSFSGIITYPKTPEIRDAAKLVPLELCLVETDAPWLAPVPNGVKHHDNDLAPFGSSAEERAKIVSEFPKALDDHSMVVPMATTNIFSHPVFKDGAITANDPRVRAFALRKTMDAIDLGANLGAK